MGPAMSQESAGARRKSSFGRGIADLQGLQRDGERFKNARELRACGSVASGAALEMGIDSRRHCLWPRSNRPDRGSSYSERP